MDKKQQFKHYNARFTREALLRASMVGLSIGFFLNFIAAFVTWMLDLDELWVMFAVLAAGFAIAMPIFYFKKFRPTVESNARRIDRYGLEERLITMVEFANDESCMAQLQRRDANEKLASVRAEEIKLRIPKWVVILFAVAFVLGAGMSTVSLLAAAGILPSGQEWFETVIPEPEVQPFNVMYMVYEGGVIEGDEFQAIYPGERTTDVIAVPDDGYAFDGWDDGSKRPTRSDGNITEDVVFTALFVPLGDSGEGEGEGEAEGEGDKPGDKPGKNKGEGDGNDPNAPPSQGAGGQYLPSNQVINGEIYYGSVYGEFYDKVVSDMTENIEMPASTKDAIAKYFEVIQAINPDKQEEEN